MRTSRSLAACYKHLAPHQFSSSMRLLVPAVGSTSRLRASIIQLNYRDGGCKGLLTGEAPQKMEMAYRENN
jgi:hypothetical protein